MTRKPRLVVFQSVDFRWYWSLVAANGKIVADGSEGYASPANARRAANRAFAIVIELTRHWHAAQ